MPVPKEEFAAWFDWARTRFAETGSYPLIDENVHNFQLLSDAYNQFTDNEAAREYLESRLAQAHDEIATRFVILNYYYKLLHYNSDLKEECITHLRHRFRNDLAFFVGLRPIEECTAVDDISWEIINACAVRNWARARALYTRLRSTEEIPLGTFHAAYGHFLFRAALGDYDPDDPEEDSEMLPQWSVRIVDRTPDSFEDFIFEISMFGLGLSEHFRLPAGRSDELLRDAKNELEKARDTLAEFHPGLRSALARCYMARGEYNHAAAEYKILANTLLDQMAWAPLQNLVSLRSGVCARVADALELAQNDSELRRFLEHWIRLEPDELGPRERFARLEAKCGNYEAAFRHLSEEHSMNPAHDQDWKATLLVELGTRAANEARVAEIVRRDTERNPELWAFMDGIVEDYWPKFQLLLPEAKESFRAATRLLFDSTLGGHLWIPAAMAAGRAVELQLRASVFDPFADAARRKPSPSMGTTAPRSRPEPLVAFIEGGPASPLTMGAMVNYLVNVVNPKEGVERLLRDWLKVHRPKLSSALTYRKLNANVDIGDLRNRATHASISREEAAKLYRASRNWLDALTDDK